MKNARPTEVKASALDKRRKDITPIVVLDCGEVFTTSILVAEKFGKRHADVLRAIEKLECSTEFTERNFALSEYSDSTGRVLPMYRISRDGFVFLAMGFTGRAAGAWKERFLAAFNRLERSFRQLALQRAAPKWNEARDIGKCDRRALTDAVQVLCERGHDRGDSTTPVALWITSATKVVTSALFETNGERISAIRNRLTARQLRRLGIAEDIYAQAIQTFLDSDLHHRAINEQARVALQAFATATGGKEVPGVDRRTVRALHQQVGFIAPDLAGLLVLAVVVGLMLTGVLR